MNSGKLLQFFALAGLTISSFSLATANPAHADLTTSSLPLRENPLETRFDRLNRGINLSHWFAQSETYNSFHMENFISDDDLDLLTGLGFQHVRLPLDPALLMDRSNPESLNVEYLGYLDSALDRILERDLGVIVDLQANDEFKEYLARDDEFVDTFAQFSGALAQHLSPRDPDFLFLEVLNEPSFNFFAPEYIDPVTRWDWVQGKILGAFRAGAPEHTAIATGYDWSGIDGLRKLTPVADPNVVYNFHFYEPMTFTHQGADWIDDHFNLVWDLPYPYNQVECDAVLLRMTDDDLRQVAQSYCDEQWNADKIKARIGLAAAWATEHNVRLTANEFGVYRGFVKEKDRVAWIYDVRTALEEYDIGWAMWDYTGGFGLFDKVNEERILNQSMVEALGLSMVDIVIDTKDPEETEDTEEVAILDPIVIPPVVSEETEESDPVVIPPVVSEETEESDPIVIPPVVSEETEESDPVVIPPVEGEDTEEEEVAILDPVVIPPVESEETAEEEVDNIFPGVVIAPVERENMEPVVIINPEVIPPVVTDEGETTRKIPEPSAIAGLLLLGVSGLRMKRRYGKE
ncbi:glycoside hydrolase family 5 protein [Laspinema olomoucense]|uniref:glycoside hydrolase family 5 protein n=1 Tax=Laspinema olomoucense TaxID=3231600 RepID=UPI0021BB5D42|nr:cellulase family glycosylhydrolase [Laspinema sp. D3c]MCT7997262.1 cellulase family glycosylhydrolase [Laspinema sp. D3c]